MGHIDSIGTFLGTIKESGVNTTKKGLPQWVARIAATQKFIESKDEMEHFKLTEPAYVDWNFDEETVAFLCLFNGDGPLLNYEQVQKATGWDGNAFDSLGDAVGKTIQFRMQPKQGYTKDDGTIVTNEGKIEVGWVDAADAPAERQLKVLDAVAIKDLNAKFLAGRVKKTAPAAVAAKPKPAAGKPATGKPAAPVAVVSPAPVTTPAATPVAPEAAKTPPAPKKKASTPPVSQPAKIGLPAEVDQMTAWEHVQKVKGVTEDNDITEAWMAACGEVADGREEASFTPADWGRVRDIVVKDLALTGEAQQQAA